MGTICITSKVSADTHFAPQNTLQTHTLLARTFCSLEHFTSQHTLFSGTLCSLEHLDPWNTLPPGDLFQGARCAEEQGVLRCKVC